MLCLDQDKTLSDAAFLETALNFRGNIDEGPPAVDFEPQFFSKMFHKAPPLKGRKRKAVNR